MEPFLKKIARTFYEKEKQNLTNFAFIFPNRRAGLFFRKYLAESAEKPIFSPAILTIKDLFEHLSGLQLCDHIQLLFKLYSVYKRITQTEETFDHFLFWGEIMLNDFDDIDKYIVNSEQLFSNLSDLKALDINPIEYLTIEQLSAIRSFWSGFGEEETSTSIFRKDFIAFWKHLQPVYTLFKQELLLEKKAYEGLMMRQVIENLETDSWKSTLQYQKIIFIGFNALSKTEEHLFHFLKKERLADFYWDYASDWVKDPYNRSSFFMERNLQLFPSQIQIQEDPVSYPKIEIRGVASAVLQAKGVTQILQNIYPQEHSGNSKDWIKTAIVLPDENLLFPLLSSIPQQINRINVTMGYSLSKSAIAGLMDLVMELQHNIHENKGEIEFYHRDVINLINHRYLGPLCEEITNLRADIIENNRIFLTSKQLHINTLFKAIFRKVDEKLSLYEYLIGILEEVKDKLPEIDENKEEYDTTTLDYEFIDYYETLLNKLEISCSKYQAYISTDTYFKLLKKLLQTISIPFQGEPLSGLQVMGVLETRSLDFENLIILSMNEGIFPLPKGANTLIPYNLRKGFGLPTTEHQDAVYAYHFYRLLQRARKVYFFYDTRSDGLKSGEVSRYILQLKYLYKVPLSEKLMTYNIKGEEKIPINIPKTKKVQETLQAFLNSGQRYLSASSINTYLQCPLKFYLLYVQQLKENEEIQERVEANTFGSLFHKTMELLYAPYCGRIITPYHLIDMSKDTYLLDKTIKKAFSEIIYHGKTIENLEGEHLLIAEILKQYIHQLLKKDAEFAPFEYIASENKIILSLKLTETTTVNLKALVDRVDKINGQTRLVDYKTGRGEAVFTDIPQLFDTTQPNRPKEILQLFLYAYMYRQKYNTNNITPAVVFLRSIFKDGSTGTIKQKIDRKIKQIESFDPFEEEFLEALKKCLTEMFDPSIPFTQTENKKACEYCGFASLCS